MSTPQQPTQLSYAIVKEALSGDSVMLRSHARGGPPKEKNFGLSSIVAPKLARRIRTDNEEFTETKDEPYAWEAREFLRKKLVGREVCFIIEKAANSSTTAAGKEYGTIYLGKDTTGENIAESLVSEGLVDVRRTGIRSGPSHQKLCELEDAAKSAAKGKHGSDAASHVRNVKWNIENRRNFMDSFNQKPIPAIVEKVLDGSAFRLLLLPDFYEVTLMLSGIKCPMVGRPDATGISELARNSEPYGEEAKFFTESRLLQRDVEVILESVSNKNFRGTILHPNGNITEFLVSEGFAKCVDWSLQCVTGGYEKLRAAEKQAKEKHLRIWKNYAPSGPIIDAKDREFQGKVVEIINGDMLMVKSSEAGLRKIFLSSIRPPRLTDEKQDRTKIRPLYDIPLMFEAREFLRKKLIGKKVNVRIDYKQPARKDAEKEFPERNCCTVTIGGVNVAEALISKGLATAVRYRADDDQRSIHYDELLSAESKAQKSAKGLHSKKEPLPHRLVDLVGDTPKAKQFLPFLQRAGKLEGIVEFVASGSRFRLFVPRENCLLTFLLAGITCVKPSRVDMKSNEKFKGDEWGDEALAYVKDLCLQREVEIEVESMDKAGNFIGWLWIESTNLSVSLIQQGYAEVHSSAERSAHYRALLQSETDAKTKKIKIWENYLPLEKEPKEEPDRKIELRRVQITEIRRDLTFYAQYHEDGPELVEMLQKLRSDLSTNVPLPGSYTPKKNDVCAAMFSEDGLWYRAKIDKIDGKSIHVTYIDYGNYEITNAKNLAALPSQYQNLKPAAHEFTLAFIQIPKDPENIEEARFAFQTLALSSALQMNVEYKLGSATSVTLANPDDQKDIGKELIESGFLMADNRREKKFRKIVGEYLAVQESAKKKRMNLWCYGDITEDDAKEFG